MPQMSPLMWTMLFLFFLISYMLSMFNLYSFFFCKKSNFNKKYFSSKTLKF